MSKIKIEPAAGMKGFFPILCAHPTVLVGADVDGKPDFAAVAWVGVAASNPPAISIALQPHRHSLKGIRQNMTFSINIPSTDLVKETDYCGLVSGAKADKVRDCGFRVFYGKLGTAPLIDKCPINHACEVAAILPLGSHTLIVGRIVETHITEECLTDGRPDIAKIRPFFFTTSRKYHALGKSIAVAFKAGSTINPEEVEESRKQFKKRDESKNK